MRPTARPESALRTPLNDILATEANVRMLRVLTATGAPVNAAELARRTLLQRSSVHRALKALETTGLVVRVGAGARSQVHLSSRHPLAAAIEGLFAAERARAAAIVAGLKEAVTALSSPPAAAWLEGPVAKGSDKPGDAVVLRVIDRGSTLATTSEALRDAVEDLERRLDVTIEVRGATPADVAAMPADERDQLRSAISLMGVPPQGFLAGSQPSHRRTIRSHADLDERARAIAAAVADKLAKNPSLIENARARIALRLASASSGERKELAEWDRLLRSTSPSRLRRFLVDEGERATRLRQTLPFLDILTEDERNAAFRVQDERNPGGKQGKPRSPKTTRAKQRPAK